MKKYQLTEESKQIGEITLHRIQALKSFGDVKEGDLGGWIEKEENLSHDGNAWVYDDAEVCGNARVCGDARVCDNAEVYDDAEVRGNAKVCGDARVCDNAEVCGNGWVCENAWVYGNAEVCGDARVCGNAEIKSSDKILWVGPAGSRNSTTTFFAGKDQKIYVSCGCFSGDIDAFEQAVKETHGDNKYGKQYQRLIALARSEIVFDDCQ